jgi:hypothetical protein
MVFAGKTTRSLPPPAVRAQYPQIIMQVSPNHWANHETKVAFLVKIWEWMVKEKAKDLGVTEEDAAPLTTCIHLLDCWPVNLTQRLRDEIKDKCPGMVLKFIPAGATGRFQINDTHIHKPLKDAQQSLCEEWFLSKHVHYSAQLYRKEDPITAAEFSAKLNGCLSMTVLKCQAPQWLVTSALKLTEPIEGEGRP